MKIDSYCATPHRTVLLSLHQNDGRLQAIIDLADEWGWRVVSAHLNQDVLSVAGHAIDGAIVDCLFEDRLAANLRRQKCPTVRLGHFTHPKDHLMPAVLPDLQAQGRLAAEHFAERRFRRLAFLTPVLAEGDFLQLPLLTAFRERAQELGACVEPHAFVHPDDNKWTANERWERRHLRLRIWLRELAGSGGVFACSDGLAVEVALACVSENIKVPDGIALLGCGDTSLCRTAWEPLSSVRVDEPRQAREAMVLLKALMARDEHETPSRVMTPPAGIAERHSTDILAVTHPLATRAIRYIWAHLLEDPTVDDVAHAVGMKRRSLERLFRKHVGSGINAEIMRRRLQVYCRELRASDEPIASLSAKMGYRSLGTMHRLFAESTGTTPAAYRRAARRD